MQLRKRLRYPDHVRLWQKTAEKDRPGYLEGIRRSVLWKHGSVRIQGLSAGRRAEAVRC